MLKYRVYDTRANKYLDRKSVAIDGNGLLQIDKRALGDIIRVPHSEKNPMFIIEQYTGLNDKNGVEIAVGDILRCTIRSIDEFVTCTIVVKEGFRFGDLSYCEQFEVIGNIHENGDLLGRV